MMIQCLKRASGSQQRDDESKQLVNGPATHSILQIQLSDLLTTALLIFLFGVICGSLGHIVVEYFRRRF